MSRHDVVKRHDFRSAMKSKEKLSSMKSVRFDGIYNGKEAEVGHGGVSIYIYIYIYLCGYVMYVHVYMRTRKSSRVVCFLHEHVHRGSQLKHPGANLKK